MTTNTDPVRALTPEQIDAAVSAAHDSIIVRNALTRPEGYSPYCMRCHGLHRMKQVGLLHWRHSCGAEHDEAAARSALASAPPSGGERRDREADRARFTDPAFNNWLDTGISDAGHTVWDMVGDVADAWAGWEARQFAGDAVLLAECCGREECGGECGNDWRGMGMYRKPASDSGSHAPPSAPVGVDAKAREILAAEYRRAGFMGAMDDALADNPSPHCKVTLKAIERALAQQPAACDMGALCIGCEPRSADGSCPGQQPAAPSGEAVAEVVEFYGLRVPSWIGTEAAPDLPVGAKLYAAPLQPAAVDEAMVERAAAAIANERIMRRGSPSISNVLDILPPKLLTEVQEDARAALTAALAAQQQGGA